MSDAFSESIESASSPKPKKPALLKGGMILCWIYAVTLALFLWMVPQLEEMTTSANGTDSSISGAPGTFPLQFGADLIDATRIFVVPLLVLSIIAAYGLAKDRHWSRWVMMTLLVLGVILIPPQLANPIDYGLSIAVAVFGWWYLYRKGDVVGYYDEIRNGNGNGNRTG